MKYRSYPKDTVPHELRCPHTASDMRPLFCRSCSEADVVVRYVALNNAYRAGEPLVSDTEFDKYEIYCRARWPSCTTFRKVGTIDSR